MKRVKLLWHFPSKSYRRQRTIQISSGVSQPERVTWMTKHRFLHNESPAVEQNIFIQYWNGTSWLSEKQKIKTKNTKKLKTPTTATNEWHYISLPNFAVAVVIQFLPSLCMPTVSTYPNLDKTCQRNSCYNSKQKMVIKCNTPNHMWIKKLFMSPTSLFLKVKITQKASGATKKTRKKFVVPKIAVMCNS